MCLVEVGFCPHRERPSDRSVDVTTPGTDARGRVSWKSVKNATEVAATTARSPPSRTSKADCRGIWTPRRSRATIAAPRAVSSPSPPLSARGRPSRRSTIARKAGEACRAPPLATISAARPCSRSTASTASAMRAASAQSHARQTSTGVVLIAIPAIAAVSPRSDSGGRSPTSAGTTWSEGGGASASAASSASSRSARGRRRVRRSHASVLPALESARPATVLSASSR